MKNLIALVAIAIGAYIAYDGNAAGLDPMDLLKVIGGVGGGSLFLLWNNASTIKNLVVSGLTRLSPTKTVTAPVEPNKSVEHSIVLPEKLDNGMYPPSDFELYDNVSLIHIRNRLVKAHHQEGIELCTKIAGIMFTLDVANVQAEEEVASAINPENAKVEYVKPKVAV